MKNKIFTCLLFSFIVLYCVSCKYVTKVDKEQSLSITKQEYFDSFKACWGFSFADNSEMYGYIKNNSNDLKAYYVFNYPQNEIDFEFETIDNEFWEPQMNDVIKLFMDIPKEYLINFSHNLSISYKEKYQTQDNIDKLYLIYDDTAQTLTVIDLRT